MNKIYVIGIGNKPLDKRAKEIIYGSTRIILSSHRLLEIFKGYEGFEKTKDRVTVIGVEKIVGVIKSDFLCQPSSLITILSSGDPLFFGIGRRIIEEFGKDIVVEYLPDLSSIQVAFSRIKEMWDDAYLMSLHGISDPKRLGYGINDIPLFLTKYNKIAILTDRKNTPSAIAKILNSSTITAQLPMIMYVCERLGCLDEKIIKGKPQEIADMSFSEPNVVIIKRDLGQMKSTQKHGATLYVIGVGPGDPELLTLKAIRILSRVPCICVPKGREEGSSLALSIVEKVLNLEGKEIIPAYFPMKKTKASKYQSELDTKWGKTISLVVDRVLERINKGMDVAFITLGDPSIYSTFFYLQNLLLKLNPNLDIEIIPGVSSINAGAARLNIPLGLANERIAILPANYVDNLKETLRQFDTVILMKVNKVFGNISKALSDMDILDRAIYISKVGSEDEKIFKDIKDVKAEDLDYFSMVIVRK